MFEYRAKILRLVDADTVAVRLDLGLDVRIDVTLRLAGINAPEMSTEAGKLAKAYAEQWFSKLAPEGFIVRTTKDRREKYGRYLATVYALTGDCLNDDLLSDGHATAYLS